MAAGLAPDLFWRLTPREAQAVLDGARDRLAREYNDRMIQSWHTAFLPVQQRPPKLKDLLVSSTPRASRAVSWEDEWAKFEAWGGR